MKMGKVNSLDIQSLLSGYREGAFTPAEVMEEVLSRIEAAPE
jgi:Asp-tRNA(Asn)/Glu-tRNA(Gln) amidotransferase A subunit family amidase